MKVRCLLFRYLEKPRYKFYFFLDIQKTKAVGKAKELITSTLKYR